MSSNALLIDAYPPESSSLLTLPFPWITARYARTSENYCHVFDLTSRVPVSLVDEALRSQRLSLVATGGPSSTESERWSPTTSALRHIEQVLQEQTTVPVRVCIPSLGSPISWGDITTTVSKLGR